MLFRSLPGGDERLPDRRELRRGVHQVERRTLGLVEAEDALGVTIRGAVPGRREAEVVRHPVGDFVVPKDVPDVRVVPEDLGQGLLEARAGAKYASSVVAVAGYASASAARAASAVSASMRTIQGSFGYFESRSAKSNRPSCLIQATAAGSSVFQVALGTRYWGAKLSS